MVLTVGEKIHIVTRRLFESDLRRHFIGEIEACTDIPVRARGYTFVFDAVTSEFVRRDEERTRVFSLLDANFIFNVVPKSAVIDDVHYGEDERNRRVVTDGRGFSMNVSEFGAQR